MGCDRHIQFFTHYKLVRLPDEVPDDTFMLLKMLSNLEVYNHVRRTYVFDSKVVNRRGRSLPSE